LNSKHRHLLRLVTFVDKDRATTEQPHAQQRGDETRFQQRDHSQRSDPFENYRMSTQQDLAAAKPTSADLANSMRSFSTATFERDAINFAPSGQTDNGKIANPQSPASSPRHGSSKDSQSAAGTDVNADSANSIPSGGKDARPALTSMAVSHGGTSEKDIQPTGMKVEGPTSPTENTGAAAQSTLPKDDSSQPALQPGNVQITSNFVGSDESHRLSGFLVGTNGQATVPSDGNRLIATADHGVRDWRASQDHKFNFMDINKDG
jgi:hypothetical protein